MSYRYFVTGAQGFVGRYLIHRLLKLGSTQAVLGIGRSPRNEDSFTHCVHLGSRGVRAPLPPEMVATFSDIRYSYERRDILSPDAMSELLRGFRPDLLFHLASALRDDSWVSLLQTNVEGTLRILEAIVNARIDMQCLVLGSTGGVYGVPVTLPLREESSCIPNDLYSASKLASEHASRIFARDHALPVVWARFFNLIGPGEDERHVCGRVASQLAPLMLGMRDIVLQVGDLTTTRDFIDVRDAVDALILVAQSGDRGSAYNIASGAETSIRRIVDTALECAGANGKVRLSHTYHRPSDISRHVASIQRLLDLSFFPRVKLETSVMDCVRYYADTVAKQVPPTMSSTSSEI